MLSKGCNLLIYLLSQLVSFESNHPLHCVFINKEYNDPNDLHLPKSKSSRNKKRNIFLVPSSKYKYEYTQTISTETTIGKNDSRNDANMKLALENAILKTM